MSHGAGRHREKKRVSKFARGCVEAHRLARDRGERVYVRECIQVTGKYKHKWLESCVFKCTCIRQQYANWLIVYVYLET